MRKRVVQMRCEGWVADRHGQMAHHRSALSAQRSVLRGAGEEATERRPTPSIERGRCEAVRAWLGVSGAAAPPVEGSLRPALFLPHTIPPVDPLNLNCVNMSKIMAAIDALKTVSIVCGMVPVVGENLKSAVELAATICEHIGVRSLAPETYDLI
jgi:hypothetical protein